MGKGKVYCYKHCYFCKYKVPSEVRSEYSFHRFPRDPAINKLWKKFCNLTDIDDARNLFLCSKHFKRSDFVLLKSQQPGNGGARLIKDAVPSIRKAATPPPVEEEVIKPVQLEVKTDLPPDAFDIELSIPTQILVKKDSNPCTTAELTNLASLLTNIQDFAEVPIEQTTDQTQFIINGQQAIFIPDSTVLPNRIQYATTEAATISAVPVELTAQIQFLSETEQAFADAQEFLQKETKPVKRINNTKDPVSDYSGKNIDNSTDVSTSKRGIKACKFIKTAFANNSKQLMIARQNFRRLRKRMEYCKRVIVDLKEENILPIDVANRLINILRT